MTQKHDISCILAQYFHSHNSNVNSQSFCRLLLLLFAFTFSRQRKTFRLFYIYIYIYLMCVSNFPSNLYISTTTLARTQNDFFNDLNRKCCGNVTFFSYRSALFTRCLFLLVADARKQQPTVYKFRFYSHHLQCLYFYLFFFLLSLCVYFI